MKSIAILLLLAVSHPCFAIEMHPPAKQEISHLFSYLENSGCRFNRNGTWYQPKEAVAHLGKKYQYLVEKNLAPSAEAFIERAATESSLSGKPYLVQCEGATPVESAPWFKLELAKYRKSSR